MHSSAIHHPWTKKTYMWLISLININFSTHADVWNVCLLSNNIWLLVGPGPLLLTHLIQLWIIHFVFYIMIPLLQFTILSCNKTFLECLLRAIDNIRLIFLIFFWRKNIRLNSSLIWDFILILFSEFMST